MDTDNITTRLLVWATRERHDIIIRLLLEVRGIILGEDDMEPWIDVTVAIRTGLVLLLHFHLSEREEAVRSRRLSVSETLLYPGVPEMLEQAVRAGQHEIVDLIIQTGIDVNTSSALKVAVSEDSETLVDRLLQAGPDPNQDSCLFYDVRRPCGEIIDKLLKAGADPNGGLGDAISIQSEAIADKLVHAGADVNEGN